MFWFIISSIFLQLAFGNEAFGNEAFGNETYKPTEVISNVHAISEISDGNFNRTKEYFVNTAIIPAIILGLGVLSFILFNVGLVFRLCCPSCAMGPRNVLLPNEDIATLERKNSERKLGWEVSFSVFLFSTLLCGLCIYFGNYYIIQAVRIIDPAILEARNLFLKVGNKTNTIALYGNDLQITLSSSNCSVFEPAYNELAPEIQKYIKISSTTSDESYRIATLATNICCAAFSICTGEFIFLIIICICSAWLFLTFILADFCIAPVDNFIKLMPEGTAREAATYYTTCIGTSPFATPLQKANSILSMFGNLVDLLVTFPLSPCVGDDSLERGQGLSGQVMNALTVLSNTTSCPLIREQFQKFAYRGICGKLFLGVSSLWLSQILTSFFLLLTIITSSVACQYFNWMPRDVSIAYARAV
eukprot:gene597-1154_t